MKIGVIGAGNWGKNLVRTFYKLEALGGVAELHPGLCRQISSDYPDVPVYETAGALLKRDDISGVAIATPAHTHYQVTQTAILAGKDVFVEKPFTLSSIEAANLVALAEANNRILMVGHLLLYQPAIRWMHEYIRSGAIGRVGFLAVERLKLGRVREVENVLWSFGVHDVAVLLYLVGHAPSAVEVTGQRFLQESIEDDVYLHLSFPGSIRAHLHVAWVWPEQRRYLTVVGSEAMLVYNELDQNVTLHHKSIDRNLQNKDGGSEVIFKGEAEPLLLECRHFLECIAERRSPISDGRSAVEVVEVLEKAQQSLKEDEI